MSMSSQDSINDNLLHPAAMSAHTPADLSQGPSLTPPPSTQVPPSNRPKTRTPSPPISHISTPPPTVDAPTDSQRNRLAAPSTTNVDLEQATPEQLKSKVIELETVVKESKMSAAHHKLQYQMLSQESAAAIERMAVEARMAQFENEVIQHAEQARSAATPRPSPAQDGLIPVQKDLYQNMCREIQLLREENNHLRAENESHQATVNRQDNEIASLTDKVILMRERIYENRERMHRHRRPHAQHLPDQTPRSNYTHTPHRVHPSSQPQQPFAALIQASEMVSQESSRSAARGGGSGKKTHSRSKHSTSSLPSTPHRVQRIDRVQYETPGINRHQPLKVPSTAPIPRTSAMRTPDVYNLHTLPVSQRSDPAPGSDGTVSASDREEDSEAETDIIEDDQVNMSQASRAASQMLRSSQEQQVKRDSFKGDGMLQAKNLKQTKLFGNVRKANVDRGDEPPAKRARTGEPVVGLGIAGVRQ